MKYSKEKETQGSRKMKQYLEDLKRNKYFRKELNKYLKLYDKESDNFPRKPDIIDNLLNKYSELGKITKRALKKYTRNSCEKITKKLAEKYSIDNRLLSYITFSIITKGMLKIDPNAEIDMCCLKDIYDDNFGIEHGSFQEFPLILRPAEQNHYIAYPVGIGIHRYATKRDVLDYIEKKWLQIEACLFSYNEKKVRIRKRKYNRGLLDFIWENQNMDIKKLKNSLDKKFPRNGLVYYEIYKIINIERKRRMQEITVGQ